MVGGNFIGKMAQQKPPSHSMALIQITSPLVVATERGEESKVLFCAQKYTSTFWTKSALWTLNGTLLQGNQQRGLAASPTLLKAPQSTRYVKKIHNHCGTVGTPSPARVPTSAATYSGPNTQVGLWDSLF